MSHIGPSFIAQFDNEEGCCICECELLQGDSIAYIDDELGCDDCASELRSKQVSKFTKRWRTQ